MRRLPARTWLLIGRGFESFSAAHGSRDAAQVAFYVLMSFPAALLLVVWGMSTVLDDPTVNEDVVNAIVDALPLDAESGSRQVQDLLTDVANGAGALGLIGIVSLLYSASGAVASLRHSVNRAWGTRDRPLFPGKALDLALVVVTVPLVVAAVALTLFRDLPGAISQESALHGGVALLTGTVAPVALLFCVFLILFRFLPAQRASLRSAWPGALAGIVGLALVSGGARAYFSLFGGSGAVYGTIGALLAAAFCVYLGSITVIYGAHVAAVASKLPGTEAMDREIDASGDGKPIGTAIKDAAIGLVVRRDDDAPG